MALLHLPPMVLPLGLITTIITQKIMSPGLGTPDHQMQVILMEQLILLLGPIQHLDFQSFHIPQMEVMVIELLAMAWENIPNLLW